jgi:hypothetical protein
MDRHDLFPNEELIADYRRISVDVIIHVLFEYGVFIESDKPEDVSLRNQGIRFLHILGGGDIDKETIREFIKRLIRQPIKKEKGD